MNCREFFEGLVAHGFVSEYQRNGVISLQCRIRYPPCQTINSAWNVSLSSRLMSSYFNGLGFISPRRGRRTFGGVFTYFLCPHTINITINRYRQDILSYISISTSDNSRFLRRVAQLAAYTQYVHTEQIYGAAINDLDYPTPNTPVEQNVLGWVMRGYPPPR